MKYRIFSTFYTACFCMAMLAQVQSGHVKTLGRPDKPGQSLEGVTIRTQGIHNAVVSGKDGKFSITMQGKKDGDSYVLSSIRKQGYELVEQGMVGRRHAFSSKVPLTIVMASKQQLQADKQRIENNAYMAAERNYKKMLTELDRKKANNELTAENYRKQLTALQEKYSKFEGLISELANHYAHTDYDSLDAQSREINRCIEAGLLEQADSMLKNSFDPVEALKRHKENIARIEMAESEAQGILDKANADLAAILKQQEKDAEYLYHLYTISLARFDNEKARYYIETRAQLDPSNDTWLSEAGWFLHHYLDDLNATEQYYQQAMKASAKKFGEESGWVAVGYVNLGGLYISMGNYSIALRELEKSLALAQKNTDDHIYEATACLGMAVYCWAKRKTGEANQYAERAYELASQSDNVQASDVRRECLNIFSLSASAQGNVKRAEELAKQYIEEVHKTEGENTPAMATALNNLGTLYQDLKDYKRAGEYFRKALDIEKKVLSPNHSITAETYNNLGLILKKECKYKEALGHLQTALNIKRAIYGDNHISMASTLNNLAVLSQTQKQYDKALDYYQQAINIYKVFHGNGHPEIAQVLHNIGELYGDKDYSKAVSYEKQALDIYKKNYGEYHSTTARSLQNIANIYSLSKNYTQAQNYYNQAIRTGKGCRAYQVVAMSYECLATIGYLTEKEEDLKAIPTYYLQAAEYYRKRAGKDDEKVAECIDNAATAYNYLEQYDKYSQLAEQALNIRKQLTNNSSDDITEAYYSNGYAAYKTEQYDKAIDNLNTYLKRLKHEGKQKTSMYATATKLIGLSYFYTNQYAKTYPLFIQAFQIYKEVDGKESEGVKLMLNLLDHIADKLSSNKDYQSELIVRQEIFNYWQGFNDTKKIELANSMVGLGEAYRSTGDLSQALEKLNASLAIYKEKAEILKTDDLAMKSLALFYLGLLYIDKNDLLKSKDYLQQASSLAKKVMGTNNDISESADSLLKTLNGQ